MPPLPSCVSFSVQCPHTQRFVLGTSDKRPVVPRIWEPPNTSNNVVVPLHSRNQLPRRVPNAAYSAKNRRTSRLAIAEPAFRHSVKPIRRGGDGCVCVGGG